MAPPLPPGTEALPVRDALVPLLDALARHSSAVLVAPPGAGKTTLVPLALLGAPWLGTQRIIMLEPRRLAARAAATRMAALLGEEPGGTIGFRTRLDSAVSARTRIEVVTEGILLRRLLGDPTLEGIGAVLLDEVHERSLDADAAMAFCLDLQRQLRPDLRLLAMSATADTATLAARMDAAVIESEGRMHPVEIRHAKRDLSGPRELPDALARAVTGVLAEADGDVLAFLPGVGEIRRAQTALAALAESVDVLPLFGELPPADQDRVLKPPPAEGRRRRVVLATSIAETSLTVPGARIVVDGGWRRAPRFDPGSGLARLETLRISRAAATQRAGRAGREAPGLCVRLWTEAGGRAMAPHDRPEILDAELSGFRLQAAGWRAAIGTEPEALPLPDPPPNGPFEAAGALLRELGALDADGAITADGERMAALGAHPRLAAMMLAAGSDGERALACDLSALLEERDPLRGRPAGGHRVADPPAELAARLDLLAHRAPLGADADRGAVARIREAATLYRSRLGVNRVEAGGDPAALVAAGFPDRIAQGRGDPGSFRLSGGGAARLPKDDRLARNRLLAVAALHVRDGARITLAAPLDPDALPAGLVRRTTREVDSVLDGVSGTVVSRTRLRLGQLVLSDRTAPAEPEDAARKLAEAAATRLPTALDWSEDAIQFRARVAILRDLDGADSTLPDLGDEVLAASTADWLLPHLVGVTRLAALRDLDLRAILVARLERSDRVRLERELPAEAVLPRRRAAIDYSGPVPTVSARAQDFYGLTALPVLAGGRLRLQAALLSPAGRPAAITADLAGFWRGGWADARRDLRGRYPRHDWPEDPSVASVAPAPQRRG